MTDMHQRTSMKKSIDCVQGKRNICTIYESCNETGR